MRFKKRKDRRTSVAVLGVILFTASILSSCYSISASAKNEYFQVMQAINWSKNLILQSQIVTHEGDLVISGNQTLTIENCEYQLIGSLTVKNEATLVVRNAIFNQTSKGLLVNVIMNQASLFLTNATWIISQNSTSRIYVKNDAKMTVTKSSIGNPKYDVSVWAEDNSIVRIENSIMRRVKENVTDWTVESRTVVCDDSSQVTIKNLTFDRLTVWANARVLVERSSLKDSVRIFGNPTVQVSDSKMRYATASQNSVAYFRSSTIESYVETIDDSDVWLIHMSVVEVRASGNSKVRLIDASVKNLYMDGNSSLFWGWDLPLFGLVSVPYTWLPVMRMVVLVLIVTIPLSFVLFEVVKRRRKRGSEEVKVPKGAVK